MFTVSHGAVSGTLATSGVLTVSVRGSDRTVEIAPDQLPDLARVIGEVRMLNSVADALARQPDDPKDLFHVRG